MPGQDLQPSLQAGNALSATQSSCKIVQGFSKSVSTWQMHRHAPCLLSVSLSRQWTASVRNARQHKFISIPVHARVMHVDMTTHSKGIAHFIRSFIGNTSSIPKGTATQVFIHWSRSSYASAICQGSAHFMAWMTRSKLLYKLNVCCRC